MDRPIFHTQSYTITHKSVPHGVLAMHQIKAILSLTSLVRLRMYMHVWPMKQKKIHIIFGAFNTENKQQYFRLQHRFRIDPQTTTISVQKKKQPNNNSTYIVVLSLVLLFYFCHFVVFQTMLFKSNDISCYLGIHCHVTYIYMCVCRFDGLRCWSIVISRNNSTSIHTRCLPRWCSINVRTLAPYTLKWYRCHKTEEKKK